MKYEKTKFMVLCFSDKRFSGEVTALIRLGETCPPDMKAAVNKKIAKVSRKLANVLDEEVVCERLNELEDIFDKIAERLEKTKQGTCKVTAEVIIIHNLQILIHVSVY